MKKILAAALAAAMAFVPAAALADTTDASIDEYILYSFERGMPTGFNKTGAAETETYAGYGGSKGSIKVTLGSGQANSSVQMPVYWISGKEYKISFYYKPLDGGSIETIRLLLYDAEKTYDFTEAAFGTEKMTPAGNGWYYYSSVYDAGKKPFTTGAGTIELRTTRSNTADNSAYLLDDVTVEPVEGYSNVLFEEDFEGSTMQVTNYNTQCTVERASDETGNQYAVVSSSSQSPRMRSRNNIEFKANTTYKFTFDVLGLSENTDDTKCMWGINSVSGYFYNNDNEKMSTSEWRTYTVDYTAAEDIANYIFSTSQGSVTNASYAIDNIRLEEDIPQVGTVSISDTPEAGVPMGIAVSGDEGLTYRYRIMTSYDGVHYITVDYGTGTDISYTPSAADTGKYIKAVVTGYDEAHAYNTVEAVTKNKTTGAFLEFTSGLSTELTGTAVQTKVDNAVAFMTAYDESGRLLGIDSAEVSNGEVVEFSLSLTETPAKAKLAVFDSLTELNQLTQEVTLQE